MKRVIAPKYIDYYTKQEEQEKANVNVSHQNITFMSGMRDNKNQRWKYTNKYCILVLGFIQSLRTGKKAHLVS